MRYGFLCIALLLTLFGLAPIASAQTVTQLQEQLVELASKLRIGEQKLAAMSVKQAQLDARITDARTKMDESRDEIDALLQSLIRLSRVPPEAIVAMPGELRHTLQAAQLMTQLTNQLQVKTGKLTASLKQFKKDELNLAELRVNLQQQQAKLKASQKALNEQIAKRNEEYKQTTVNLAKQIQQASEAKRQSANVKQLEAKLEKIQPPQNLNIKPKPVRNKNNYSSKQFTVSKGRLQLPAAGYITKRFGQKDGIDQTLHGHRLTSTAGSTVISPADGEVMFTGPFLDYGNIVIIRYDQGYNLLLAGLESINCTVGQKVISGEPVGRLSASNKTKADLYIELRKNGKPIDPSGWFG